MGIFGKSYYSQTMSAPGAPGTRSRASGYDHRPSAINVLLPMIVTFTIADAEAGDFEIAITDTVTGEVDTIAFTSVGIDNDAVATGLAANANGKSPTNDTWTASSNLAVLTLNGKVPGRTYTFEVSAPGAATITPATSQGAGGTDIAPGRFVVRKAAADPSDGKSDEVRAPTTGDAIGVIWGLAEQVSIPREIDEDGNVDRNVKPGERIAVAASGYFWVESETPLAVSDTVFIRVTATGTEVAGTVRNNNDGGDAISAAAIAKVITPTTEAGGTAEISINIQP